MPPSRHDGGEPNVLAALATHYEVILGGETLEHTTYSRSKRRELILDVINEQETVAIDEDALVDFARRCSEVCPGSKGKMFAVALLSDTRMIELNKKFRGKPATTDVLSFPSSAGDEEDDDEFLGDIAISADQAQRQASEAGLDLEIELKQLILHGLLHLCGFDHETDSGEMDRLELELRDRLGIS